jgi:hypothetical protein
MTKTLLEQIKHAIPCEWMDGEGFWDARVASYRLSLSRTGTRFWSMEPYRDRAAACREQLI